MFNQYPYLNLNDLNLDYILKAIKEMRYEVTNFVSINAIKYANPIQWNITSQYEKNTIVIDPLTGTAYISVAAVPAGVNLTRPEYWTVVFDLQSFVTKANQNLAHNYEEVTTTTATMNTAAGQWVIWGDILYKALVNITAGDAYVVGSNIERVVIEDVINAIKLSIADEIQARIDADITLQGNIDLEVQARQDADTTLQDNIDLEVQARQDADDALSAVDGDLNDLTTTDKSSLVAAINEVNQTGGGAIGLIGDLDDLVTADKSNVVAAINEVAGDINANKRYIALSEIADIDFNKIQDAIDNYDVINFDVNVDIGSNALTIPSGREIFSSNGSHVIAASRAFTIEGERDDTPAATLSFSTRDTAVAVGTMSEDTEYMIISDMNCIGTDALNLGYPNYMGGGTDLNTQCFPAVFTTVHVNGNNIKLNVPVYGSFPTGKAYAFNPVTDVYIHDLILDCSANDQAHHPIYCPIELHYASNCELANIKCIVGFGNCITVAASHDIIIRGCSCSVVETNFGDLSHASNNVYRIAGGYNVMIENCSGVGSQPYDFTYRNADPYCSAYCKLINSISLANYTGMTCHPGTWCCTIDGLQVTIFDSNVADGIMLRGSNHIVCNCVIIGAGEVGSYGIASAEGSLCHTVNNNMVQNFEFAYYIQEVANRPFSSRGTPFVTVTNNTFVNCATFLRINRAINQSINIYAVFKNNVIRGNSAFTSVYNLIHITGTSTGDTRLLNISELSVINKSFTTLIQNDTSGRLIRCYMLLDVSYSPSIDKTAVGGVNNCFLSIRGGNIDAVTTAGTAIPAVSEYNT